MTTLPLVMFWFADATVLAFRHRIVAKADSTELQHVFSCAQRVSALLTPTTPPAGTARAARSPQTTACRSVSRSGARSARGRWRWPTARATRRAPGAAPRRARRQPAFSGRSSAAGRRASCPAPSARRAPPGYAGRSAGAPYGCAARGTGVIRSSAHQYQNRCCTGRRVRAGDARWRRHPGPFYRGGLSSNVTIAVAVSQGMSIVQTGSWRQTVWSGTR